MVDYVFKQSGLAIREMAFGCFEDISNGKYDAVYMHSNETRDS